MAKSKKKIPRPVNYKVKAKRRMQLFARLVKYSREELRKRGEELTYKEAQKFVSLHIYPRFKGLKPDDVKVAQIKHLVDQVLDVQKGLNYYNPLMVPQDYRLDIDWWEAYDLITMRLIPLVEPQILRLQFSAGPLGDTGIFETSDYSKDILEPVIEEIRRETGGASGYVWNAIPVLRQGFADDGNADHYYLRYILYDSNGSPLVDPTEIRENYVRRELTPEQEEEMEKAKAAGLQKTKTGKQEREDAEKQRKRREAERPTEKQGPEQPVKPPPAEKPAEKISGDRAAQINTALDKQMRELEMLRADYQDGIFSKDEYKAERAAIIDRYKNIISRMESGGIL